jgi:outer membrane lipoprotein-sorting protein
MRRLLAVALLCLAAAPAGAAVPGYSQFTQPRFTPADQAELDQVSTYLNGMHTLEGSFVQIGPEGQTDEGRFYLAKPGRMRFEYAPPNPTLVVSDGSTVAVTNKRLNTTDKYPIWATPLSVILADHLDLKRNQDIISVTHQEGQLVVGARSHSSRAEGNITLVFSEQPGMRLKQWTVIDAQGLMTTVTVNDLKPGAQVDPSLFEITSAPKLRTDP